MPSAVSMRRRADQPGDPRSGPGLGRRAAPVDRAGRGHLGQLFGPDDRPPPPRADDRRDPAGLRARARRAARAGAGSRGADHGRARSDSPGRVPALVHDDPAFASFFRDITPIRELSDLRLGSRPAARGRRDEAPSIDLLRAIPWTFAWSQSRINLPGWYGLGPCARGVQGGARREGVWTRWPASPATGRSCRACSTTPR